MRRRQPLDGPRPRQQPGSLVGGLHAVAGHVRATRARFGHRRAPACSARCLIPRIIFCSMTKCTRSKNGGADRTARTIRTRRRVRCGSIGSRKKPQYPLGGCDPTSMAAKSAWAHHGERPLRLRRRRRPAVRARPTAGRARSCRPPRGAATPVVDVVGVVHLASGRGARARSSCRSRPGPRRSAPASGHTSATGASMVIARVVRGTRAARGRRRQPLVRASASVAPHGIIHGDIARGDATRRRERGSRRPRGRLASACASVGSW